MSSTTPAITTTASASTPLSLSSITSLAVPLATLATDVSLTGYIQSADSKTTIVVLSCTTNCGGYDRYTVAVAFASYNSSNPTSTGSYELWYAANASSAVQYLSCQTSAATSYIGCTNIFWTQGLASYVTSTYSVGGTADPNAAFALKVSTFPATAVSSLDKIATISALARAATATTTSDTKTSTSATNPTTSRNTSYASVAAATTVVLTPNLTTIHTTNRTNDTAKTVIKSEASYSTIPNFTGTIGLLGLMIAFILR